MKVAFLSQPFDLVLPPEQTSVGLWTYEVARRLAADCEVTILARRPRGAPMQAIGPWGRVEHLTVAPLRLWSHASRAWSRISPPAAALIGQPVYAVDLLYAALRRLRAIDPHVIHVQNFPHFAPPLRKAFPNAVIVLHMHCDWLVEFHPRSMARCIAAVDTVIGCSAHVARASEARFGPSPTRFVVVPNGAPPRPNTFTGARRPGQVVFVGRVSPEKGVHTLLEAWPSVVNAIPGARLDIVGPPAATPREFLADLSTDPDVRALARFYPPGAAANGAYHSALKSLIPPGVAGSVKFVGHEPHERVIERIEQASVLANPSLSESFGMSLVEALSAGVPVVATRVGGMTEIIEEVGGGLLVAKNDAGALAAAIIGLLADPDGASEMARRAMAFAQFTYSWDRIAALTREVYEDAATRRRRSRAA